MKKNIKLFISNDFITVLGDGIFTLILMWHVYETTQSALYTAIIGTIGHLTSFFIGPIAGVIADRSKNPLKLLIKTLHINIILIVLIVTSIYFLSDIYEAISILILIFLRESIFNLQYPTQTRLIPKIADTKTISKLIGYRSVTSNIASIIGNSVAGFILALVGVIGGLMFNSFAFLLGSIVLGFIKITSESTTDNGNTQPVEYPSIKNDLIEGLKFIWEMKEIRIITIVTCLLNISSMIGPMFVVYFNDFINAGPTYYGFFNAILAIGSIISGLLIGNVIKKLSNVSILVYGWLIMGFCLISMTFQLDVIFLMLIAFLLGISLTLPSIILSSMEIIIVPDHLRGRVSTAIQSISVSLIPIANIAGGIIADIWNVNYVFLIAGIWQLFIVLLVIRYRKLFNSINISE